MERPIASDQDLVGTALREDGESDAYWEAVRELQRRGTQGVFKIASDLSARDDPRVRQVGLDILAQLGYERGRPFLEESLPIVFNGAADPERAVRRSALSAMGHLGDVRSLRILLHHVADPDPDIRLAVAQSLPSVLGEPPSDVGTSALTELSGDSDPRVRDWATFALGSLLEVDSDLIRQALSSRLDDPDGDTAGEALVGLARRRDPKIVVRVGHLLQDGVVGNLTVEAAAELADRSFIPSLERLKQSRWAEKDPRGWLLEKALTACRLGIPMND